jgi:competence protein ComEC
LSGGLASFAEALITGERGAIPKEINESLQVSGLAHVLSISGLHLSLVAGGIFWLVRALLALSPALAQRRPIKKWAAVAALLAGFGYMLLAGAGVATQRSYIMLAIMFVAILLDRPAISMRNLAIAALVVLATTPEAALAAGFQMSFMAVMGLAAFYQTWSDWRASRKEYTMHGPVWRMSRAVGLAIFAMAATTLVAGSLSSIPAAYHFGRIAPLSLVANVLALPIISFIVMPFAVVAVLLMPLGLEAPPLWIMGEGVRLVLAVSDGVAGLPAARLDIPPISASAAAVMTAGAVFLCLWRGLLRLAGVGVLLAGLLAAPFGARYDVLVDPTASTVAVRGEDGLLVPADPRRGRFAVEKWLSADGEAISPAKAAARPGWTCQDKVCVAEVARKRIGYIREGGFLSGRCAEFDVLIADFPLRGACRANKVRIDRFDVWRNGAYALTVDNDVVNIHTSRGEQGARPWTVTPIPRRILVSGDFDEIQ